MLLVYTPKSFLHFTPNVYLIHKPSLHFSPHLHFCKSKRKFVSVVAANSSPVSELSPANSSLVSELSVASTANSSVVSELSVDSTANSSLVSELSVASTANSSLVSELSVSASDTDKPKHSELVVSFLKEYGFSDTQLEKAIQTWPRLLTFRIETNLKPKFKFFQDFGFSNAEIADLFSNNPWVLSNSLPNTIEPVFALLSGLLGSDEGVKKLLKTSCWFLRSDLDKLLVPNVDYLLSCGVDMDRIRKNLYRDWRLFLCKPEVMKRLVDRADRLGADRSSPLFLEAVKVVKSMSEETYERKMQAFLDLGFSEDDIRGILAKVPTVLALSSDNVNGVIEALLATGKYTMKSIISNPRVLTYSLEKRYKPRLRILEVLERKNLVKKWPTLKVLSSLPNEKFSKRFVAPHLNELSEVLPEGAFR